MQRAQALLVDIEEALRHEGVRVGEVGRVVVRGVRVENEGRPLGDGGAGVDDVFDALAREGERDVGPVAEGLFDQGDHVGHGFFLQDFVPGVTVGVGGHDFGVGFLLDALAFDGAEELRIPVSMNLEKNVSGVVGVRLSLTLIMRDPTAVVILMFPGRVSRPAATMVMQIVLISLSVILASGSLMMLPAMQGMSVPLAIRSFSWERKWLI